MRGNAGRVLLPALVVLGLVGVVAVAATGSTPSGTDDSRPPGDAVLETILSLGIVALIPGAALLVYGLSQRRAIAEEMASRRYSRSRAGAFIFAAGLLFVVVFFRLRQPEPPIVIEEVDPAFPEQGPPQNLPPGEQLPPPRELEFAWIPVLVVLLLIAIGVGAYVVSSRRAAGETDEDEEMATRLANALDESLDDLRAEGDPRRAVIAAYARLELVLASQGLARGSSETPGEYLARIFKRLDVDPRSVRELTDLFTEAKFSSHTVDTAMKERALDSLSAVRDELRARRDAERAAAAAPTGEPSEAAT